jgi:hypothetical protein
MVLQAEFSDFFWNVRHIYLKTKTKKDSRSSHLKNKYGYQLFKIWNVEYATFVKIVNLV